MEGSISIFRIITLKFPPYNYVTTGWFFYNIGFILGIIIESVIFIYISVNIFYDENTIDKLIIFIIFTNLFWIIISIILFLINT